MVALGISPSYFLDEMSQSEVSAALKADIERSKSDWEQTRLQCFYSLIAQAGNKKIKKPTDLFSFPWEKEERKKVEQKPLSPEAFNALVQKINIQVNGN